MKTYINKLKSVVLVAAASLTFASCGDFLEVDPMTFVSEDNFWNEKADIDQMVAGVYVKMQADAFIQRCIMWGETRSDNIVEGLNASGQTSIYRTLKENLLSTNSYTTWVDFYAVINQCNTIIEMAPVVSEQDPVYTESDVLATQAEMKALRALSYFYLVRAFKDVPFYTYAIQSEDDVSDIAASPGDSIVPVLIEDLEDCVSNALKAYPEDSNNAYDSDKNRITQNAIYAILCDLCLWDGQYDKVVTYADRVIKAKYDEYQEDYSAQVNMSSSTPALFQHTSDTYNPYAFPLYPCYSGNNYGNDFNQTFGDDQNGFESLFELAFTYDGTSSNYIQNTACSSLYGSHVSSGNDGSGYLAVAEDIITDINNSSFSVFLSRYDCRWYSCLNPDDDISSGYAAKYVKTETTITSPNSSNTALYASTSFNTSTYANRNWIFYRLTDVMLMEAEALIEMSTDVTTSEDGSTTDIDDQLKRAFYLIWTVARRSYMTTSTSTVPSTGLPTLDAYGTKDLMLDLCLKERRREFLFEGKRWFDLLRQCHKAGTPDYIKSHVSAKGSSSSSTLFTSYEALFWPYNKDEVKNNGLLSQKPYYGNDDDEDSFTTTR